MRRPAPRLIDLVGPGLPKQAWALPGQTIWEVFEAERPKLVPYAGRFDGFHAVSASVSKTCLVRFDNNKYSVVASAVGRPVEVHAYADRIVVRQDGRLVAEHPRSFGRGDTIYDPWHYVPVLARKPGALRNGAPFKDWVLPASMERVRRKLAGADDGNRQMVDILTAVLTDGLPAVEAACAEAVAQGVHSADVVINILARQRDPGPPATILTPAALTLLGPSDQTGLGIGAIAAACGLPKRPATTSGASRRLV